MHLTTVSILKNLNKNLICANWWILNWPLKKKYSLAKLATLLFYKNCARKWPNKWMKRSNNMNSLVQSWAITIRSTKKPCFCFAPLADKVYKRSPLLANICLYFLNCCLQPMALYKCSTKYSASTELALSIYRILTFHLATKNTMRSTSFSNTFTIDDSECRKESK